MNAETEICQRLVDILRERMDGIEVKGNWLVDRDYIKGADVYYGAKIDVNVRPRKYEAYTTRIATFEVSVDGEFDVGTDDTLERTVAAYEKLVDLFASWQHAISTVKSDLAIEGVFDPVGVRMDGGTMEIDRETCKRTYSQQLTLKGRIN